MNYNIEDEYEGFKFSWNISMSPSRKPPAPKVVCYSCNGCCKPYFGMMDDPVNCFVCNNTGVVDDPQYVWKPPPPKELLEGLQSVVKEFWNKQQNDNFRLE